MNQNNSPQQIWDKLKTCQKVLLTLHTSPDGDSLGSNAAMKYLLERDLKIEADLVSVDGPSQEIKNLSFAKTVRYQIDPATLDLKQYDAIICIDQADNHRVSRKTDPTFVFGPDHFIINIDHHYTNTRYGSLNYVGEEACSSCEVLVDFCRALDLKFDTELAKRLLTGICSDTGFFRWGMKGSSKPLHDAAFLIDQGVDLEKDVSQIINAVSLKRKQLEGLVYSRLQFNPKHSSVFVTLPYEIWSKLGMTEGEVGGMSNLLSDIEEADFIYTITEYPDRVSVSFRSAKGVDVSRFSEALGGGGHQAAAGAKLASMPLKQAEQKVIDVIDRVGINKS